MDRLKIKTNLRLKILKCESLYYKKIELTYKILFKKKETNI